MPTQRQIKLAKSAAKHDFDLLQYDSTRFDDPKLQRIYTRKLKKMEGEALIVRDVAAKMGKVPMTHSVVRREIISLYGTLLHPAAIVELRRSTGHQNDYTFP